VTVRGRSDRNLLRIGAKLLLGIGVVVALHVALVVGWLRFEERSDPERLVEAPLAELTAAKVEPYAGRGCGAERSCRDVALEAADGRAVRIAISLPAEASAERLPVVILTGGLRTGREALEHVPDLGRNAVVSYEYPLDEDHWRRGFLPLQVVAARNAALAVPGQLAALVRWVRARPWADPGRVSLVGVSLGALVLPAAQRAAAAHGERLGPSILAYGGTGLFDILRANLAEDRPWVGYGAAWLASLALRALEPAAHLPQLKGEFLLINGQGDPRIPARSAAELHRLTPEPKEVRVLGAGHFDADDPELLAALLELCRAWLVDRGALNP
jgi:dienelactone hydrolase